MFKMPFFSLKFFSRRTLQNSTSFPCFAKNSRFYFHYTPDTRCRTYQYRSTHPFALQFGTAIRFAYVHILSAIIIAPCFQLLNFINQTSWKFYSSLLSLSTIPDAIREVLRVLQNRIVSIGLGKLGSPLSVAIGCIICKDP